MAHARALPDQYHRNPAAMSQQKPRQGDTRRATLSPVVLIQQAAQFLDAARREFTLAGQGISVPAYFLAARSIELALKSFLVFKGRDERQLRRLSHNLALALADARQAGLDDVCSLRPDDRIALNMINPYYLEKDLEYLTTGYKQYPGSQHLLGCADYLIEKIAPLSRSWRPA